MAVEKGMDSYNLIGQYMDKALKNNKIISISEAKDAIVADYAAKMLTDGDAARKVVKSSPDAAQAFTDILSSLKTGKERKRQI